MNPCSDDGPMRVPPDLADRLKQASVLVVGDLMLDRYFWGEVSRISPEAPVPVVKVTEKTFSLGGSGNVAANLAGLGCPIRLVGLVGVDPAAEKLRDMMASAGIADHCLPDDHRPTITKTRIMAGTQQVVRLDEEVDTAIDPETAGRLLDQALSLIPAVKAVILSDYGKGLFQDTSVVQTLIQTCRNAGIPVFVDPKGKNWERYAGATCITPNTAELEAVHGARFSGEDELVQVTRRLRRDLSLDWLLVTRGPRGMALVGETGPAALIPARTRDVFDVSGAGDTVIAALAAGVSIGLSFPQAAAMANMAAGIVVGKVGTQPVHMDDLMNALSASPMQDSETVLWKVADPREAAVRVSRWRQAGQRIVFTNGCFDLLHPGHVSLLHKSRGLGDRLVVGLNTDASICRLKGPSRPILPGEDRAAILSALGDVDMVVFFDEDTPLNLISLLKPDVLVKGADYRIEAVVGGDVVKSYGGEVRLVDLLPGHSTTAIAKKLAAGNPSS